MIGKYDLEDEVLISKLEFGEVSEEEGKEKREMYDNRRECKIRPSVECGVPHYTCPSHSITTHDSQGLPKFNLNW